HFAAIDWVMSIHPSFTSTIFGPIVVAGQLLSAFAPAVIVLCRASRSAELVELLSPKLLLDVGNLLLTLVIVWAYLVWCQFMLIWIADLPRDNIWWLARGSGGWRSAACLIVILHFAVPFFLLLVRVVKQDTRSLGLVAALVLLAELVFVDFQVTPW